MLKKRVSKKEYKDTFDFRLFPEYTYTVAQKKRFRLFQGRIEHWRAAVNYADYFNDPNRINLLYLIGYPNGIEKYVEKTQSNLVVLCADVPDEFLKVHDEYWDLVKSYCGIGYASMETGFSDKYFDERAKENKHREDGLLFSEIILRNDKEAKIIEAYEQAKKDAVTYFSKYRVICRLFPDQFLSYPELDKIIKKIFPYGKEQIGMGDCGYLTGYAKLNKAVNAGLVHADCSKILCINGRNSYEVCKKGIRRCEMNLNVALRKHGFVNLTDIMDGMKFPPYGWGHDLHAAYCFGYALSSHLDSTWIFDELTCFPTSEIMQTVVVDTVSGFIGTRKKGFTLVEEAGCSLAERIAFIFGMEGDEYIPGDSTDLEILRLHNAGMSERKIAQRLGTMSNIAVHKRLEKMRKAKNAETPMCVMASWVCVKIEGLTQWPVSIIDQNLRNVLCGEYDDKNHISIPVFGQQKVRKALSYFSWDKCKEIKNAMEHINEIVPELLRQKYGLDVDVDEIKRNCTTQCSGWLWDADFFWDCVNRNIK